MTARDDIAKVLCAGEPRPCPSCLDDADALLASPVFARLLDEARADGCPNTAPNPYRKDAS